ncbi:MAG: aldo/keto reductase, partial [Treponema sp.]|nr:aldo/keto reductase [Treponema sp.]
PLYGGLVQNTPLALGYLYQFENVVPLWGVRNLEELEQILYFNDHPPVIDEQFKAEVEKVRDFFN